MYKIYKTTKVFLVVFYLLSFVSSCNNSSGSNQIEVIYDNEKAIAIVFSSKLASDKASIFLDTNNDTSILGSFSQSGNQYTFRPAIPFSGGNTYTLVEAEQVKTTFTIDAIEVVNPPELTAIYPTTATVPENLLKMYFQFSKPMQEVGNALDYITIINTKTGDTTDVFLELNTELWNNDHTRLTLWLDPGRIKTDLIPNKERGLPIINGNEYKLIVDSNWLDAQGNALVNGYEKIFSVLDRDPIKPSIDDWEILVNPDVFTLHFKESMDAALASKAFQIKTLNDEVVLGEFELINKEKTLKFLPEYPFALGEYTLIVDSKLEDLAGNNLNHPFDKDLTQTQNETTSEFKTLKFTVENIKL